MNESHLIFVYGTLKRDFPNHHLLQNAIFIGKAITKEKYPMIIFKERHVPILLNITGIGNQIIGEVYQVDDKILQELDELEIKRAHYSRKCIQVCLQSDLNLSKKGDLMVHVYMKDPKDEFMELKFVKEYTKDDSKRYIRPK